MLSHAVLQQNGSPSQISEQHAASVQPAEPFVQQSWFALEQASPSRTAADAMENSPKAAMTNVHERKAVCGNMATPARMRPRLRQGRQPAASRRGLSCITWD